MQLSKAPLMQGPTECWVRQLEFSFVGFFSSTLFSVPKRLPRKLLDIADYQQSSSIYDFSCRPHDTDNFWPRNIVLGDDVRLDPWSQFKRGHNRTRLFCLCPMDCRMLVCPAYVPCKTWGRMRFSRHLWKDRRIAQAFLYDFIDENKTFLCRMQTLLISNIRNGHQWEIWSCLVCVTLCRKQSGHMPWVHAWDCLTRTPSLVSFICWGFFARLTRWSEC